MRTVTYNLQQILAEVKRGYYVIPRFQRQFVWNNAQVKLLVDSIARNYPIGSLLLLHETSPKDPFLSSRPIDGLIKMAEVDPDDDNGTEEISSLSEEERTSFYYVLDGQQRLTSIARVFLQLGSDNYFYFDLKKLLGFDSSDRPSPNWVVKRKSTVKMSSQYIRSDAIADSERCQVLVDEYFESAEDSMKGNRPAQRKASAKVNKIFETIRNYQIPLVVIDRGDSTEAICRIFETINSTGTRLTTFDLAVARFFPKPDLHELWRESREKFKILERFDVDGERALQIISLSHGYKTSGSLEATRSALFSMSKENISLGWDRAVRALADAYSWVENRGLVPKFMANEVLLVPLAFFLSEVTDDWKHKNPGYEVTLERWYFSNVFQQGAVQASNYQITLLASSLRAWLEHGKPPEAQIVNITVDDILRLHRTDNRYRGIQSILRWKGGRDLWTGEVLDPDDVEDHHIFPAAYANRSAIKRKDLDSIANRVLVSTITNRKLSDRMPADYFREMLDFHRANGTIDQKNALLKCACIPSHDSIEETLAYFDQSRIPAFLRMRAELMLDLIKSILGDCMKTDKLSGSDELPDSDD